jgi:hypothetical protein
MSIAMMLLCSGTLYMTPSSPVGVLAYCLGRR